MAEHPERSAARAWRVTFWLSALLALLLVASLAPYMTRSAELVRVRNALLYENTPADANWTPATLPAGWLAEHASPTPMFARIVRENELLVPGDDWETALRIGKHLLAGTAGQQGGGGAIQLGLADTYQAMTERGSGYCGDYVDVFTALANASGIFARSWAFSFDGFGGHGHIFNEISDRKSATWRMVDVFNNYYVVDESERPFYARVPRGDHARKCDRLALDRPRGEARLQVFREGGRLLSTRYQRVVPLVGKQRVRIRRTSGRLDAQRLLAITGAVVGDRCGNAPPRFGFCTPPRMSSFGMRWRR